MNAYGRPNPTGQKLKINDHYVAESIEKKMRRIMTSKEPITDGAPQIFTERKDGVQPAYNIRTDRFELAVDAMDAVTKTNLLKREMRQGERTYDTMTPDQQAEFHKKFPKNKFAPKPKDSGGTE